MTLKMCFNASIENENSACLGAKTSNVTWTVGVDEYDGYGVYLYQTYEEPLAANILCFCPENRTIFKFEKTSPWPVIFKLVLSLQYLIQFFNCIISFRF